MSIGLTIVAILFAAAMSLVFSTFAYALRDFSKPKVEDFLEKRGLSAWFESTVDNQEDLIFVTACLRLLTNILVLICVLHLGIKLGLPEWGRYVFAVGIAGAITMFTSVAVPHALAEHAGEKLVATNVRFLHGVRYALLPATRLMHGIDSLVAYAVGVASAESSLSAAEDELKDEILSVVEEGSKEGAVDDQQRNMIESVIRFSDRVVGHVMVPRPKIVALPVEATLEQVRKLIETSGHSRLPVYQGTIDHMLGVLHARDLLLHATTADKFELRATMRSAFYVPESKPLTDLLNDFRRQRAHLAVVLDEYGGTSGIITIVDVLEELVGDISDEYLPTSTMIRRIDDATFDVDAAIALDELNQNLDIQVPEDAGYETLGGFVSNTLGRIPAAGTSFEHAKARYTIVAAEPQRVTRVKIELIQTPTVVEPHV